MSEEPDNRPSEWLITDLDLIDYALLAIKAF